MGGEKTESSSASMNPRGSPPRGRGKEVADEGIGGIIRITSAWAGKSPACRVHPCTGRDHPRVGGEKYNSPYDCTGQEGSPPRGRGKGTATKALKQELRITPAWAGKSGYWERRSGACRDHPRMGGEKPAGRFLLRLDTGSPPRGRGKDFCAKKNHPAARITPALAGKR